MIWNGLRVALAIFSGKISLKFGLPERHQTLRESIFTGRVVEERSVLPAEPPERVLSSAQTKNRRRFLSFGGFSYDRRIKNDRR
jgi:hypothetical protein